MKKIVSIISAFALILSAFSMVSFAAGDSVAHTVTLVVDEGVSTTVKAGEEAEIPVSVVLDYSEAVSAIGYTFAVQTGLEIDTARNESYFEENEIDIPGAVDVDWYDEYGSLKAAKKWGDIYFGVESTTDYTGVIFGVAKTTGISSTQSTQNMVIGKYIVKVPKTVAAGTYQVYLSGGKTTDAGASFGTDFVTEPLTITVEGEPEVTVPTAATLGLFTDASQNFKVTEDVMTSNGWTINKALAFVSGIYADADVITFGTEITCEDYDNKLDIPAAHTYEAAENVKGFVAAVTSIRNDNLNKKFTARAYADVTVDGETTRIYAENAASAVYGN